MYGIFKMLFLFIAATIGWMKYVDILKNCVTHVYDVEVTEILYVIAWSILWVMIFHHWDLNGKNRSEKSEVPE